MGTWEKRSVGKPPAFNSPDEMWERAVKYFEWCEEEGKIEEEKLFSSQGQVISGEVKHMRAMTQAGLCLFLNIGRSTWHDYCNKPAYSEVTQAINDVMDEQKFTGAASGRLNHNIIARDLGLADTQNHTSSDGSMSPKDNAEAVLSALQRKHKE